MRSRWSPFDEMTTIFRDLDRLFRRTFSEWTLTPSGGAGSAQGLLPSGTAETRSIYSPAIEVYHKDKDWILKAELPGINPEDIDVSVVDNQLRLRGERKQNQEISRDNYYLSESSYGRFERAFTRPEGVKPDKVKASYTNGILEIRVPAQGLEQKTHRIPIEGAAEAKKIGKPGRLEAVSQPREKGLFGSCTKCVQQARFFKAFLERLSNSCA